MIDLTSITYITFITLITFLHKHTHSYTSRE